MSIGSQKKRIIQEIEKMDKIDGGSDEKQIEIMEAIVKFCKSRIKDKKKNVGS